MAAMADNSLLATAFWPVLRRLPETNRKVSYWQTTGSCSGPYSSVAVHVNRSSFKKIKICSLSSKDDYQLEELRAFDDGGPPRWFSPVECGCRSKSSPLLLFLPGIDGVGLGLMSQYKRLGEIFDIWCLHIPVADRTPLTEQDYARYHLLDTLRKYFEQD